MAHYDFRKDLPIARETEKQVAAFFESNFPLTFKEECNNADYDLLFEHLETGNPISVEVKEDFMCEKTGNVGVEYHCRGKHSGIAISKSDFYVYKVHRPDKKVCMYAIKTVDLKQMIKDNLFFRRVTGGDKGSNSKNYLFRLPVIQENFMNLGIVPA